MPIWGCQTTIARNVLALAATRKFSSPIASTSQMSKSYEIRSGGRPVSIQSAGTAQEALIDYLRSLGCRNDEIVRLGVDAIAWRGARYSAAPVGPDLSPGS